MIGDFLAFKFSNIVKIIVELIQKLSEGWGTAALSDVIKLAEQCDSYFVIVSLIDSIIFQRLKDTFYVSIKLIEL